jgi:hypothetical protein
MDKISQVNPTLVAQLPLEIPETELKGWISYVEKYLTGDRIQDSKDFKNVSPSDYSGSLHSLLIVSIGLYKIHQCDYWRRRRADSRCH